MNALDLHIPPGCTWSRLDDRGMGGEVQPPPTPWFIELHHYYFPWGTLHEAAQDRQKGDLAWNLTMTNLQNDRWSLQVEFKADYNIQLQSIQWCRHRACQHHPSCFCYCASWQRILKPWVFCWGLIGCMVRAIIPNSFHSYFGIRSWG